jgi:hypothetical protein
LEHRMGFEPMNTGFADQRVSHFAIGAHIATKGCGEIPTTGEPVVGIDSNLLRLRRRAQIRLHCLVTRKDLVRILVGNRSRNDHIVALLPIRRRCYLMLRG